MGDGRCTFCGARADLVPVGVIEPKWYRRFGGGPAVALDHGWYTTTRGERRSTGPLDPSKSFCAQVRVACDFCAHGWLEDVRWRAEPMLLSVAQGRAELPSGRALAAVHRWAATTAVLAECIDGMPRACSEAQRDALRRGAATDPLISTWAFAVRQRLPARVHLSQVPVSSPDEPLTPETGLLQIVSVDLAHVSVLVVLPSTAAARAVVDDSGVTTVLGRPLTGGDADSVPRLDLSKDGHPHQVAVQRLCTAAAGSVSARSAHPG